MGLLDEWFKVKKDENNPAAARKFALGNNTGPTPNVRQADRVSSSTKKPFTGWPAGQLSLKPNPPAKREVSEAYPLPPSQPSLMDQLMAELSQGYERPQAQQQQGDGGLSLYMKSLDDALAAKLGAIGGIRNQAQQNFQTSDQNLASMFGATANNIATQGSQRFGEIAQANKQGILGARDESLNRLQADQARSQANRQAMLQALGIQEAGAAVDPGDQTMQDAMTGITNRSNIASQGAEQAGTTNQAYNQSVVNSVNQQGAERRGALTQQLAALQNQLGMAEADAQSEYGQQKAQLQAKFQEAQANAAAANNEQDYKIWSDRQNLVFDLWKTITDRENKAGEAAQDTKVQGFGGLAQDLLNQGVPQEQASQYMNILSNVIGGEYMKGVHPDEGYDRASILARRLIENGVPAVIAGNLATNYSNLGNNAYFNAPAQ